MLNILCFSLITVVSVLLNHPQETAAQQRREILVSAAMSLKNAFEELGRRYEATHNGTKVTFNFGASGDLMRQIEGGAPVDVFASAASQEMDRLEGAGLLLDGSRTNFASNSVVLVVPVSAGVKIDSFVGLKSDGVKKIAVGNFKTVPAGRYAEEALRYYRLMPEIRDKLIFAENVRQIMDYVARGEVDAGIVYATDFLTRPKEMTVVMTAPVSSHKPIIYPVALIRGTRNREPARQFIAMLLSTEGAAILKKYGFGR